MSEEGLEAFEVSPQEEPQASRREPMANAKKFLHVTIVDHNPVIDGTDDSSYVDVRIPIGMVESGLHMIPTQKLGDIDPDLIVQMVEMGAEGELVRVNEEKKSISIRVE